MEVRKDVESWAHDMQEFRRAAGFCAGTYEVPLRSLCSYCRRTITRTRELDKDTVLGWLEDSAASASASSTYKNATVVRALANYINAFGGRAYVLPLALQPTRKSTFVPRMPDDRELSDLFAEIDRPRSSDRVLVAVPGAYSVLCRLIYTCGLRPGEGVRAKTADLDLAEGTLFIRETKFHRQRVVALSEPMAELLCKYCRRLGGILPKCEYLFPASDGSCLRMGNVSDRFRLCWRKVKRGLREGDIPRLRVYDLRHRFASAVLQKWLDEGRDIYAAIPLLRAYMGHSSLSSTLYYVHLLPESLRASKGIDWDRLNSLVPEVTA